MTEAKRFCCHTLSQFYLQNKQRQHRIWKLYWTW